MNKAPGPAKLTDLPSASAMFCQPPFGYIAGPFRAAVSQSKCRSPRLAGHFDRTVFGVDSQGQ